MTKAADRATDLLVQRTTEGLDPEHDRELAGLLERFPELDPESFELAAAAIELTATVASEPLPTSLRQRVLGQAHGFYSAESPAANRGPNDQAAAADRIVPFERRTVAETPRRSVPGWTGWLAAAAVALVALGLWPRAERALTPHEERQAVVAQAGDLVALDWTATEDPAASGASGGVVWSSDLQRGFMTFRGLPVNDPGVEQYQLWIFDAEQDERYPVDGGVFDVSSTGEVIVEIDPKLHIRQPTLFAITIEKPGGVVVSSRERLPLLAQVG